MSVPDLNRAASAEYTREDGRPTVLVGATLVLVAATVLLAVGALFLLSPEIPSASTGQQGEYFHTIAKNMRFSGVLEIIGAIILAGCLPGLWNGKSIARTVILWSSVPLILLCIMVYTLRLGGASQLVCALLLAVGVLLSYRTSFKNYFV